MRRAATLIVLGSVFLVCLVLVSPAYATYHGRNGRIAFAIDRGDGLEIYTMRHDGTDVHRLTSTKGSAFHPDWSPDGSKIVFGIDVTGGTESLCTIMLMNADGSGLVDLTRNHRCDGDPSFMPGGHRILFLANGGAQIETMNLEGGDRQTILHRGALYKHNPVASPDGRIITFLVEKEIPGGNRKGLYRVNRNGSHVEKIVPFRFDISVRGSDWAPHGHRVAFTSQAGPTPVPGEPSNLFTIRPDGTGLRQLTQYTSPRIDVRVGLGSYSPSGRWLMFKRGNKGKNTIWKIRPDGTDLTRILRLKNPPTGAVDWGSRATPSRQH